MKWQKLGLIINLKDPSSPLFGLSYAQSPQVLVKGDHIRIYFSTRSTDITGGLLSNIVFVDFDVESLRILRISQKPVISLGSLGTFDEHGIFPINVLSHEGTISAYTCGWSRRGSVPVETSTGLAYSFDDGDTFQKHGSGPVLTSSLHEPFLVGDSFVRFFDRSYHMWYIFGTKWLPSTAEEPVARIYKIGHTTSLDGVHWTGCRGMPLLPDVLGVSECQALPSVVRFGSMYHMYFCYREATCFRSDPSRSYRIGYAFSHDLVRWTRDDSVSGLSKPSSGWDSEMMCYPHVFEFKSELYILYNGNGFGRDGFGLAKLLEL